MRRRPGSPVAIGLIALGVLVLLVFLGFTKDIPFTTPYQVKATFESANSIRVGSPVRIAGVNVGKVAKVTEDGADIDVDIAEGVRVKVARSMIADVRTKGEPVKA